MQEVAQAYQASVSGLRAAAQAFGVTIPTQPRGRRYSKRMTVIAGLLRGESQAEMARCAGVTRQYVSQIKQAMTEAGIFDAACEYAKERNPR